MVEPTSETMKRNTRSQNFPFVHNLTDNLLDPPKQGVEDLFVFSFLQLFYAFILECLENVENYKEKVVTHDPLQRKSC